MSKIVECTEKLMPCIWCGSTNIRLVVRPFSHDFFGVICCSECKLQTQSIIKKTQSEVEQYLVSQWNALPRKLKWTKETPIKPGIYWARINDKEPVIIYVDVLPEGPLAGQMVCYIAGITEDVLLKDVNKETEWAGPIPEPIEE